MTLGPAGLAIFVAWFGRLVSGRAKQHDPDRLSRVGGARNERLPGAVKHNLRGCDGVGLLPEARLPAEDGFAAYLVQLRLGSDGVCRAFPAKRSGWRGRWRVVVTFRTGPKPGGLYVSVCKGIGGRLGDVNFVCRELQASVFNTRVSGKVQPFPFAFKHGLRCGGPQDRRRRCARFCCGLLPQHHAALDGGGIDPGRKGGSGLFLAF